jgi:hypothetical protein
MLVQVDGLAMHARYQYWSLNVREMTRLLP